MIRVNLRDRIQKTVQRLSTEDYEEFFLEMKDEGDELPDMVGRADQWEEHREWQFDYVTSHGLESEDRLLDVGCGPLRFGLAAIPYLHEGNYVGFDISPTVIEAGMERVEEEGLTDRRPTLLCNKGYKVFFNAAFDVIWAQSVLTHIPPDHVAPFFGMIANNVKPGGQALVTYNEDEQIAENPQGTGYRYPLEFLQEHMPADLELVDVDRDSGHPNGQHVLHLRPVP